MDLYLSFSSLGSPEIEEQVIADLEELLGVAEQEDIIPMYLTVGPLFMQISSVQSLICELDIKDWQHEIEHNYTILKEIIQNKLKFLYDQAEKSSGLLDLEDPHGLSVLFDPDDFYMSLICKINSIDIQDSNDAPYRFLKFKEEEILPKIRRHLCSQ